MGTYIRQGPLRECLALDLQMLRIEIDASVFPHTCNRPPHVTSPAPHGTCFSGPSYSMIQIHAFTAMMILLMSRERGSELKESPHGRLIRRPTRWPYRIGLVRFADIINAVSRHSMQQIGSFRVEKCGQRNKKLFITMRRLLIY